MPSFEDGQIALHAASLCEDLRRAGKPGSTAIFGFHGCKEKGSIATPSDLRVQNELDRFHVVQQALDCLPRPGSWADHLMRVCRNELITYKRCIDAHGRDVPEIR